MAAEDRHTRGDFDQALRRLEDDLLRMGVFAGTLLTRSIEALKRYDGAAAAAVVADDDQADRMHIDIEQRVMGLLATQQPIANDLRTLAAILAVSIDLERMADHAEGIGDATLRLTGRKALTPPATLTYMEQIVRGMVHDVLEAFVRRDVVLAEAVAVKDETVDTLRGQVFRELLTYMAECPRAISPALDLMLVAQHLERAADHVTNVAERVIYMVTGEMRELNTRWRCRDDAGWSARAGATRDTLGLTGPRATLRLRGVGGVPAAAMLETAERVRQAVALLGIVELCIEVVAEQEVNGDPPAA